MQAAGVYSDSMKSKQAPRPTLRNRAPTDPADRVRLLRQRLTKLAVDALLVTNPRDIRYLTGFVGDDSWALVLRRSAQVIVLSDFRFEEQIQREAPQVRMVIRTGPIAEACGKLVQQKKLRKVAVGRDYLTLAQQSQLIKHLGRRTVVPVDDGLLDQRSVKDAREVKAIRDALAIQQQAFTRTLDFIKPGRTEVEIAAYLEYQMRLLGADGPSFPTIVAVDANASLPHAIPGKAKIKRGSLVLIDWGARQGGYCSDLTRCVAVGRMSPKMREVYQIVLDAQLAGIAAIAPGKELKAVDAVARQVIIDAGYGPQFGHSLGHGIGLDIHEQPTLSTRSQGVLKVGQVVTVEPGIYLPGVGGVRIEDDVLVTPTGGRVLSSLPKSLESAIISVS